MPFDGVTTVRGTGTGPSSTVPFELDSWAFQGTFSANTERAIRSDLRIFSAWCGERGVEALPAAPETVAAFVGAMAASRAPATVRRYVASIAAAHRAFGHAMTVNGLPEVRVALQRMHRAKGRLQGQAHPLTWPLRQQMLAASDDRLIDLRNQALLAVAYDTMLRRSELSALEVVDLTTEDAGDGSLLVRRSKTDAQGAGAVVYLAQDTVRLVSQWIARAGIEDGRLFRSVRKSGEVGDGLDPSQIPRIFKAMARRANVPEEVVERLSGHSTRVGAAHDMIASGIELPAILQAGRWKTAAMVTRYGERLLARRSGAAQLARLQHRQ